MARVLLLLLVVLALAGAPFALGSQALSVLTTALIAALFAVAFNLLSGQAGMLSFGHAAYFAIGGFSVIHAMQAVEAGSLWLPTPLVPLAGGVGGLAIGLIAGVFATRRSGAYFSMVTLAIAELLYSVAPTLVGLFGGESGLSSMRQPWGRFDYGSDAEVYYTILIWTAVCIGLLYVYNQTLFGRLTVGLRESERRLSFLGYNVNHTKIVVFAVSAMFSGVAGGLLAFATESANYSTLAMGTSASVILHTFVGGPTVFLGPAVGAILFTAFGSLVSDLTRNWLLYQGVAFVLIMLFMSEGLVVLFLNIVNEARERDVRSLWLRARLLIGGLLTGAGFVFAMELFSRILDRDYQTQLARANVWPPVRAFGMSWAPADPLTWIYPAVGLLLGIALICATPPRHDRAADSAAALGDEPAQ